MPHERNYVISYVHVLHDTPLLLRIKTHTSHGRVCRLHFVKVERLITGFHQDYQFESGKAEGVGPFESQWRNSNRCRGFREKVFTAKARWVSDRWRTIAEWPAVPIKDKSYLPTRLRGCRRYASRKSPFSFPRALYYNVSRLPVNRRGQRTIVDVYHPAVIINAGING